MHTFKILISTYLTTLLEHPYLYILIIINIFILYVKTIGINLFNKYLIPITY